MEDTLFMGDFPIETPILNGFPLATFDYQRVPMTHDGFVQWDASFHPPCHRMFRNRAFHELMARKLSPALQFLDDLALVFSTSAP